MTKFLLILLFAIGLVSCNDSHQPPDDKVKATAIDKTGSIETKVGVIHKDNCDIFVTESKVWCSNTLVTTKIHRDTVPSLGKVAQTISVPTGETDDDDNTIYTDETVPYPKEYKLYLTVQ